VSSPRWRPASLALAAVLVVLLTAACGHAAAATTRVSEGSASVVVRGPLVSVRATTLTVDHSPVGGSVRVAFAPQTTPIYGVTATTAAAIEPGFCVAATGERDATGTLTASVIVVASSIDDTCPEDSVPAPPPPPGPLPSPTPSPGSFPLPTPTPGPAFLRGQVLSVGARAIAVQGPEEDPAVVILPPDDRVLFFEPGDRSSLVVPSCVVIQGTRRRRAIAARQIVDWPSGTGC
jgi:hypothetical protein